MSVFAIRPFRLFGALSALACGLALLSLAHGGLVTAEDGPDVGGVGPKPTPAPKQKVNEKPDQPESPSGPPKIILKFELSGMVVDATGTAVAGAAINRLLDTKDGKPVAMSNVVSAADGTFKVNFEMPPGQLVMTALSADAKQGAWVLVPDSSMKREKGKMGYRKVEGVKLTLGPLGTMAGKLSSPVPDRIKVPSLAVYALHKIPGAPKPDGTAGEPFEAQLLVAKVSNFGAFKVGVPAGKYRLISGVERANGGAEIDFETQTYEHELTLAKPLELGELKVQLTKLNRLLGQEMPDFKVTEARNTEAKKLKDFKGKWVLLEFWGFWCPSCVAGALPDAIDFWEENKALRDKFTIIAFHDAQARTMADLDKQLAQRGTSAKYWKNRKIEFPIWLDSTDTAHKSLEIPQYPTAMLIDPEGKLMTANATTKLLGEKLGIQWERKGGAIE